jgi:hypothetical protein
MQLDVVDDEEPVVEVVRVGDGETLVRRNNGLTELSGPPERLSANIQNPSFFSTK